ncbi:hypothetical protein GCM10010129_71120 [Streptomyces fumigatiscleroticus]|nr:hypothetical protein GCM10010129_71120 [Streptomyces fumigatiscleroticus]
MRFGCADREFAYPAASYEVGVAGDGEGGARVTVTATGVVRDLLLQADRLAAEARTDQGRVTLLPGESTAWRVTGWSRPDAEAAVREAVRYLAALGHRRIARVGGHAALGHTVIRTAALDAIVAELGLEPARNITTDYSGEQGARATRSLLASPQRPTAIVYDNDIMAVAGLSVAAEMGLSVPRDLSLIAWDDSQLCRLTHPTLSAMTHDVFGFGADVTRRLFDVVHRRNPSSGPVATPVLLPRGSSAPPRDPTV